MATCYPSAKKKSPLGSCGSSKKATSPLLDKLLPEPQSSRVPCSGTKALADDYEEELVSMVSGRGRARGGSC